MALLSLSFCHSTQNCSHNLALRWLTLRWGKYFSYLAECAWQKFIKSEDSLM